MNIKGKRQLRSVSRSESSELSPRGPLLVSKGQTAETLSVCLRTVDNLIANKQIAVVKIGKRVLVKYASLLALTRRSHVTPAAGQSASAKELVQ